MTLLVNNAATGGVITKIELFSFNALYKLSKKCGDHKSSLSTKEINSPLAKLIPLFLAIP